MKDRRAFVRAAGAGLLVIPLASFAQQSAPKPARIAILSPGANESRSVFTAFRMQLRTLGYEEGRDIALEFFFAKGSEELAASASTMSTLLRTMAWANVASSSLPLAKKNSRAMSRPSS